MECARHVASQTENATGVAALSLTDSATSLGPREEVRMSRQCWSYLLIFSAATWAGACGPDLSGEESAEITKLKQVSTAGGIVCVTTVDNPHQSTSPGRADVPVKGHVVCTSPVSILAVTVRILYKGVVQDSRSFAKSGVSQIDGIASADPCVDGPYQGEMDWYIQYPPGIIPPEDNGTDRGNAVNVKCWPPKTCDETNPGLMCPYE
jgi:hypothetical protein